MDSIRQYFKRTDKMYLLLCIFSSVMAVLALSSWAAKQGNGFATDEVTGAIIGIGDYRRALVQLAAPPPLPKAPFRRPEPSGRKTSPALTTIPRNCTRTSG